MYKQKVHKGLLSTFFFIILFTFLFFSISECRASQKVIPIQKVVLSADDQFIEKGDVFKVTAQITPNNATYRSFTWSVVNDSWFNAVEKISGNKFKAIGEGSAIITAYQKDTKKKYELRVEVRNIGTFHIEMNHKKVNKLTAFTGGHLLIEGMLDDTEKIKLYYDQKLFKYSIKDSNIATIDEKGQITALKAGSTSVKVTAANGKSISCTLTVTAERGKLALDTFYAKKILGTVGIGCYGDDARYSNTDNTYIFELANKQIGVFKRISTQNSQSLQLTLYGQEFNYLSQKNIKLPYTEWGGFHQGEDGNYYAAVGQENENEDNTKVVFTILKLDSNFVETARCNITGAECNTREPYAAGCARMTMSGTTLIVHTDRLRYKSSDGKIHQSNISFFVDSATMQQSYVGSAFPYNQVSHSFNQFVKMDGNNLIYIDHGDAYPRAVVAQTHYNFSVFGLNNEYDVKIQPLNLLNITGNIGNNTTGTKVNGFETGTYNNIVAGVSIPHDSITEDTSNKYYAKNVYISLISKDGTKSELKWLTDYKSDSGLSANNLRMVKISDNEFALIYQLVNKDKKSTSLIVIDSKGTIIKTKNYDVFFSCYTQPIYYNNSIVWIDSSCYEEGTWFDNTDRDKEICQFTRIYLD